ADAISDAFDVASVATLDAMSTGVDALRISSANNNFSPHAGVAAVNQYNTFNTPVTSFYDVVSAGRINAQAVART
ncbi:MAG: hypothetical protein FWE46_04305, partial [Coriobacteriia bacterium]|nr:hypothetical protein [Coriobacteriia bacterium]MCL2537172.1 hypothetical protein [Coriobacteriia bacterium]